MDSSNVIVNQLYPISMHITMHSFCSQFVFCSKQLIAVLSSSECSRTESPAIYITQHAAELWTEGLLGLRKVF